MRVGLGSAGSSGTNDNGHDVLYGSTSLRRHRIGGDDSTLNILTLRPLSSAHTVDSVLRGLDELQTCEALSELVLTMNVPYRSLRGNQVADISCTGP